MATRPQKFDINKLVDSLTPSVRRAFLDAIADLTSEVQIGVFTTHIKNGDIERALQALHLDKEFFEPVEDVLRQAYIQGGRDAIAGLPAIPDPFPGTSR